MKKALLPVVLPLVSSFGISQPEVFGVFKCSKNLGITTNVINVHGNQYCKNIQCCNTTRLLHPPYPWCGGAAWVKSTYPYHAYVSDGKYIDSYSLQGSSCGTYCKGCYNPMAYWYSRYHTYVTAMAANSLKPVIYIADSTNTIRAFSLSYCNMYKEIGKCRFSGLPRGSIITGLAYSFRCDLKKYPNGVLLAAAAKWYPPSPGTTVIMELPLDARFCPVCKAYFSANVRYCKGNLLLGPATGLAFDQCKSILFISDHKNTLAVQWICYTGYKSLFCCPNTCAKSPVDYYGLGLKACYCSPSCEKICNESYCLFSRNCLKCKMDIKCVGNPSLGNLRFGIALQNGPAILDPKRTTLNVAVLWLNFGACKCTPVFFNGCKFTWCGLGGTAYKIIPYMGLSSGCVFNTIGHLPILFEPSLCCSRICAQWTVVNFNGGEPYTNCISFSKCMEFRVGCP